DAFAVVLHGDPERLVVASDADAHFGCLGMLDHIRQGFTEGKEELVPILRIEDAVGPRSNVFYVAGYVRGLKKILRIITKITTDRHVGVMLGIHCPDDFVQSPDKQTPEFSQSVKIAVLLFATDVGVARQSAENAHLGEPCTQLIVQVLSDTGAFLLQYTLLLDELAASVSCFNWSVRRATVRRNSAAQASASISPTAKIMARMRIRLGVHQGAWRSIAMLLGWFSSNSKALRPFTSCGLPRLEYTPVSCTKLPGRSVATVPG